MLGHAVSGGCTASCEVAIATIDKARLSETWPAGNVIFGWVNGRYPSSHSKRKTFYSAINFQAAAPFPKKTNPKSVKGFGIIQLSLYEIIDETSSYKYFWHKLCLLDWNYLPLLGKCRRAEAPIHSSSQPQTKEIWTGSKDQVLEFLTDFNRTWQFN